MAKKRKGRIEGRMRQTGLDPATKDRIQIRYSLPREPLPNLEEAEAQLAADFHGLYEDVDELWVLISTLHTVLIEKRATLTEQSKLRIALDFLGAKGFADARTGYISLKHGYQMGSLGPLRAGFEGGDLMDYLSRVPGDAALWLAEDAKFDNLGWVRKHLPVDAGPFYDFLNWGMHANWRMIPHLMRRGGNPLDTYFEIVPGPVRNNTLTEFLAGVSVTIALRVVALLHDHSPRLVSPVWSDQFRICVTRTEAVLTKIQARAKDSLALLEAVGRETYVDPRPN